MHPARSWSRGRCKPLEAGGSAALPATPASATSAPGTPIVDVVVEIQVLFVQVESRDLFCPKEEQLRARDVLASPDPPCHPPDGPLKRVPTNVAPEAAWCSARGWTVAEGISRGAFPRAVGIEGTGIELSG